MTPTASLIFLMVCTHFAVAFFAALVYAMIDEPRWLKSWRERRERWNKFNDERVMAKLSESDKAIDAGADWKAIAGVKACRIAELEIALRKSRANEKRIARAPLPPLPWAPRDY